MTRVRLIMRSEELLAGEALQLYRNDGAGGAVDYGRPLGCGLAPAGIGAGRSELAAEARPIRMGDAGGAGDGPAGEERRAVTLLTPPLGPGVYRFGVRRLARGARAVLATAESDDVAVETAPPANGRCWVSDVDEDGRITVTFLKVSVDAY